MDEHELLGQLLSDDRWRMGVLRLVCDLGLPDGFVQGDFVRSLVWDHLHGRPMTPLEAVDVLYWDPERLDPAIDESIRQELSIRSPKKGWRVRNAALSKPTPANIEDVVRREPETATAVAVAVDDHDRLTVLAPYGLSDLFDGIVRPVRAELADIVRERVAHKGWQKLYPRLRVVA